MDERERCLAWGVYISAALYLAGVFAAGLAMQNAMAWKLALFTAGLNYVSYTAQIMHVPRNICFVVVLFSAVVGACAGIVLIP